MNYIKFIYLIIIFTGPIYGEVWDDYPSTQEEFLNQDQEFKRKFNQISDLKKLAWKTKPDSYEQRDLLRKIKKEDRLLKSIILKRNLNKGPYKFSRDNLDHNYHGVYTLNRQKLQDKIVSNYIKEFLAAPKKRQKPIVIYTAGVGGVGKGFAISKLRECGFFKRKYITIDPDEIKKELPEFKKAQRKRNLKASEKAKVSSFVHQESGYIDEIIEGSIYRRNGSLIIDGTLQNFTYSRDSMKKYKNKGYIVKVIYITAPKETIFKRVEERAQKTGRDVPRHVLNNMLVNVEKSIEALKKEPGLIDQFIKIDNGSFPTILQKRNRIPLKAPSCRMPVKNLHN